MSKKDHIVNYYNNIQTANKELTKKELFKDLLHRLYPDNKEIQEVLDAFSLGSEKTILNIPRKDKIRRGSADTLYNNIIIEFENDLSKSLTHAKEQLAGYLLGQHRSEQGYNYTLIVSDFVHWKVFVPDLESIQNLDDLNEHELVLSEVKNSSFVLTESNYEDFYYYIDRFLFKKEKQKATLESIERAFGSKSNVFLESFQVLNQFYVEAKRFNEVQVSFQEWKKFLSVAYGSFDGSDEKFLIHSYLSIFSKMLGYETLSSEEYIDDEQVKGILDGSIFHQYNIDNFVTNDFFHWVTKERTFNNLKKVFRLIAQEISTFDFDNVEEDVLKGVYQELIDLDTRQSLGEYYTPDWLCERIVNEFDFTKQDKILDPSCGSGSFLRASVKRLRELNPDISAEEINESIYGIDIHPLSVQIAKTTFLLSLGKNVENSKKPIHLNIILANTLLAPTGVDNLYGNDFELTIDREKLLLNTKILENSEVFDRAVSFCDTLAEHTKAQATLTKEDFQSAIEKQIGDCRCTFKSYYKIYKSLKKAKEEERDSIWKFIILNLYKPHFLSKSFTHIVGNPPWFTYSSVKNEEYQDLLLSIADKQKIKPSKKANMPHLEIAAVFLTYCSDYFLKKDGQLAFVLPRSFFNADHHDNTRSGAAQGFSLTGLWDLDGVHPLFRIPSCVLWARKKDSTEPNLPSQEPIEGKVIAGTLSAHNCNWEVAKKTTKESKANYYYAQKGSSSAFTTTKSNTVWKENPYKKLFKQGATIVPRTFYFVDLNQETPPDFDERIINIKSSDGIKKDAKKPWKGINLSDRIESQYLFRTAISKNILPFHLLDPVLVTLPIDIQVIDGKKKILMLEDRDMVIQGDLNAARWFKNVSNIWNIHRTEKNRSNTSTDYLNWQNKLLSQNLEAKYLVIYTASAKDANATIVDREDIDLEFIVESTTYVHYTNNKNEANYLCCLLNSKTPNELIKDFQARGLFGARHVHKKILDVPFPKFNAKNEKHIQLAELGETCHSKAKNYVLSNTPDHHLSPFELGRYRLEIKNELKTEMDAIDDLVKKLL